MFIAKRYVNMHVGAYAQQLQCICDVVMYIDSLFFNFTLCARVHVHVVQTAKMINPHMHTWHRCVNLNFDRGCSLDLCTGHVTLPLGRRWSTARTGLEVTKQQQGHNSVRGTSPI